MATQIKNIDAFGVDIVTRGAIKRRFLIVKSDNAGVGLGAPSPAALPAHSGGDKGIVISQSTVAKRGSRNDSAFADAESEATPEELAEYYRSATEQMLSELEQKDRF